jgi:hypothetical protein
MPTRKPPQTLADYVIVALSPTLIMALVGSLVFFLLEVVYAGQYSGRLQWTLFFFIFAAVLIARIAIENGDGRAGLYALGLGVAVWLSLQAYVEYGPNNPLAEFGWAVNAGLMAIIWWCAHRLTWDCTYIDDRIDASGKGVLEAAGLDEDGNTVADAPGEEGQPLPAQSKIALVAWWDRYRRYREQQLRKPHTPGVWVVYFSLAALPLFGLGQSLVPVEQESRRRYVFWLMVLYVASGLGLLVTTSFLGLRRYLRQRRLRMPVAVTGIWMTLGGALIVVLMLLGALLPRPYGEYQVIRFTPLGSQERQASRYAVNRDGSGKGQGSASNETDRDDQKADPGSGNKTSNEGEMRSGSKSSSRQSGDKGSRSQNDQGSPRDRDSAEQPRNQDSSKSESQAENDRDQQKSDEKSADQDKKEQDAGAASQQEQEKNRQRATRPSKTGKAQTKSPPPPSGRKFFPEHNLSSSFPKLGRLATILKWIVFGVLAAVVVFYVLRTGLRFLANFTNWAKQLLQALRAWWEGLFGAKKHGLAKQDDSDEEAELFKPPPFSAFHNPFLDGSAERLSPDRLVHYSFEALQSWAFERKLERQPDETPLEFALRLTEEMPALEPDAGRLAGLYARVAYARGKLGPGCLADLRQFWQRLETVHERPLSA